MGKSRCLKLQSASYFGACVFALDTLVKLWDLLFSIVLIGFNWSKYGNLIIRAQVINAFFSSVYCTFSFILVFFLFRGLYQKMPGVIKLGAVFVLVLRLWECAGSLVSWDDPPTHQNRRDEFGVYRAEKVGRFIVVNLSAAAFVVVLFLYNRSLLTQPQRKRSGSKEVCRSSTSTLSI